MYAIVPLNVKATSLNCSTRLLNQPQSTNVKHGEIIATWFRISLADVESVISPQLYHQATTAGFDFI